MLISFPVADHDQLFNLVYERVRVTDGNLEPHLWSYRQRISIEHLGQTLLEKKLGAKHPILYEFLQRVCFNILMNILLHITMQEHSLRATQYLPDIVKLQRSLYDAFHHRLDRRDAKMITFRKYLESLINGKSSMEVRHVYFVSVSFYRKYPQ